MELQAQLEQQVLKVLLVRKVLPVLMERMEPQVRQVLKEPLVLLEITV